jgi:hypothetical protein
VASAVELVALEMVPVAVKADLDDVTSELFVGRVEPVELGRGGDAATVGAGEGVAVDVGDKAEVAPSADWAGGRGGGPDVATGPQELRMGVADVVALEATGAEVPQDRPSGQRVVDVPPHGASVGRGLGPISGSLRSVCPLGARRPP